jgi:hypothetical protein
VPFAVTCVFGQKKEDGYTFCIPSPYISLGPKPTFFTEVDLGPFFFQNFFKIFAKKWPTGQPFKEVGLWAFFFNFFSNFLQCPIFLQNMYGKHLMTRLEV